MVRPSRAAEIDDRAVARGRLAAMRLRTPAPGWVPEPVVEEGPRAVAAIPRAGPDVPTTESSAPAVGDLARGWVMDRAPLWTHHTLERLRLSGLLMGVGLVVAVVVAGIAVLHHGTAGGYSSSYNGSGSGASVVASPPSSDATGFGADASSIVVDVGGRVRKPGLVTLPAGARVADAIAAAGGPLHHKEIATLDLAARVSDGQLLLVGVPAGPAGAPDGGDSSSAAGPSAPVGLNSATLEELETLPGVGPVTAQKIIDWRTEHNGFTTVMQLQQVSGIGPAKYAELSPLVTP